MRRGSKLWGARVRDMCALATVAFAFDSGFNIESTTRRALRITVLYVTFGFCSLPGVRPSVHCGGRVMDGSEIHSYDTCPSSGDFFSFHETHRACWKRDTTFSAQLFPPCSSKDETCSKSLRLFGAARKSMGPTVRISPSTRSIWLVPELAVPLTACSFPA